MLLKLRDRRYYLLAFKIIGDLGATIAIPVVILAIIGKKLDTRFATSPWLTIAGFVLAFTLSAVLIRRKAKKYGKEYQDIENYGASDSGRTTL